MNKYMGESLKRQCPEDHRKRIAELQREIENLMDAIAAGQLRGSAGLPRRTESTLDPTGTYASRPLARPWTGQLRPPASKYQASPANQWTQRDRSRRCRSARYV